jgi:type VI secretion system FHA domain protein
MELRLEVERYRGLPATPSERLRVDSGVCTLGRNPDNDLALADPERMVSGRHARIEVRDDGVWLIDQSTNGTFLNQSPERVPPNQPVALQDGDMLSLGPYEIAVSIAANAEHSPTGPSALEEAALPGMDHHGPAQDIMDLLGGAGGQPAGEDLGRAADPFLDAHPLDAFLEGPASMDEGPRAAEPRPTPVEHVFFRPPETQAIPEEYDLLNDELLTPQDASVGHLAPGPRQESEPAAEISRPAPAGAGPSPDSDLDFSLDLDLPPCPSPPADQAAAPPGSPPQHRAKPSAPSRDAVTPRSPPESAPHHEPQPPQPAPGAKVSPLQAAPTQPPPTQATGDQLTAFLAGLGIGDPEQIKDPATLLHDGGALLRVLTEGLATTMMARARFKSELRLGVTTIRRAENNPFKFSVSPEEAIERLLLRPNPAYMPPLDAAREAFEDVQAHEMAIIAGLRAALRALLARFEPSNLETRMNAASGLDKLLPMARKSRYWDQFTQTYEQVAADAAEDFMQLFGESFARAYEDQILRLAEARRRRPA